MHHILPFDAPDQTSSHQYLPANIQHCPCTRYQKCQNVKRIQFPLRDSFHALVLERGRWSDSRERDVMPGKGGYEGVGWSVSRSIDEKSKGGRAFHAPVLRSVKWNLTDQKQARGVPSDGTSALYQQPLLARSPGHREEPKNGLFWPTRSRASRACPKGTGSELARTRAHPRQYRWAKGTKGAA